LIPRVFGLSYLWLLTEMGKTKGGAG
jgi:hypothetical protein